VVVGAHDCRDRRGRRPCRRLAGCTRSSSANGQTGATDDALTVIGNVWVRARPAFGTVRALVGDVTCAEASTISIVDSYDASFTLTIPSNATKPGCGAPGATVRFTVNGAPANETMTWEAGEVVSTTLVVGPPFARFVGEFRFDQLAGFEQIVPFIGSTRCGVQINPLQGEAPSYGFDVIVDPEALVAGCGDAGDEITLVLVDGRDTSRVVATTGTTATWVPTTTSGLVLSFTAVQDPRVETRFRVDPAAGLCPTEV